MNKKYNLETLIYLKRTLDLMLVIALAIRVIHNNSAVRFNNLLKYFNKNHYLDNFMFLK